MRRIFLEFICVVALLSVGVVHAQALPEPNGAVILTVSGKITHTNFGDRAVFDREMLEALEQKITETTTPWSETKDRYEGPLGRALLDAVGVEGAETMVITALNDYSAEVPVSDFMQIDVILALKHNDAYMRVRDKGPLFVIYPFDDEPKLKNELYYNRSVWQIRAIEFR
ncbi:MULTISPECIES: putative pterin-binding protein [Nitrincola]|uniref:Oxidoreductase molybdopterin binding domain protein n=1 Tax=Nitrincola nitratireducens TaxID=1229521 RepID=W9VAJ8_9GAMM|nr:MULTISPECIES: molybdopterin-dependent oxidoreductase [Nitrincola]EXJ13082.1 Oxidoreductase molybdopterin binding domain protein [Nitrincola nitratireducens]